ncbi:MAG: recombinase family protein, partial [Vicinamibacterales bacterium]|nr:recombinase family protein [Vicinamibacterales bacterium]
MVREIFELCAGGEGLKGVAKRLNAAGAPAPRAQQGRRSGWAPSSVREVLHRSLYRGEIVWNRTKKRDAWGQKRRHARPEAGLAVDLRRGAAYRAGGAVASRPCADDG